MFQLGRNQVGPDEPDEKKHLMLGNDVLPWLKIN